MLRQSVLNAGTGTTVVTVPDRAIALISVSAVCNRHRDSIGAERDDAQVAVSSDLSSTLGNMISGTDGFLLAKANLNFPPIPVSAGERLLVAFEEAGSAVFYYQEES